MIKSKFILNKLSLYCYILVLLFCSYYNSFVQRCFNLDQYKYDGIPILSNLDGFYFLIKAQQINFSTPLLSKILLAITELTSFDLSFVAFYSPFFLFAASIFFFTYIALKFFDYKIVFIGIFFVFINQILKIRADIGFLDTDSINILLIFLISYLNYNFINKDRKPLLLNFLYLLTACVFLSLWWNLSIGLFSFIISYIFLMQILIFKNEIKLFFILLIFFISSIVVLSCIEFDYLAYGSHLFQLTSLIFKNPNNDLISQSITELSSLSLKDFVECVGGLWFVFLSLLGFILIIYKDIKLAIIIVPSIVIGLLGFYSQRFIIFLVFPMVFTSCYVIKIMYNCLKPKLGKIAFLFLIIVPILSLSQFVQSAKYVGYPLITKYDILTLTSLKNTSGRNKIIWTWWDYGYFAEYITGIPSFVNGGSQNSNRTYLVSKVLSSYETSSTYYITRFFSAHNVPNLSENNVNEFGPKVEMLYNFYKTNRGFDKVRNNFIDKSNESYFPKGLNVYLFLPQSILNTSMWWYHYGKLPQLNIFPKIARFEKDKFRIDYSSGVIKGDEGLLKLSQIENVNNKTTIFKYKNNTEAILIDFENYPAFFVMDSNLYNTIAVKLLTDPDSCNGFIPIDYVNGGGGVWKISGL